MLLRQIDLTTALRPSLLPDETLLFVQDSVGLYEGKNKISEYQNGHAYLTSHRACYVDNEHPRKACVAIDLQDVERFDLSARFLKSSPKITLYSNLKAAKSLAPATRGSSGSPFGTPRNSTSSPLPRAATPSIRTASNATWICPICSFSNPIPSNFDPVSPAASANLPPCLACGIKPPLSLLKAALDTRKSDSAKDDEAGTFRCPRCTFENHPSLLVCEICGQSLVAASNKRLDVDELRRSQSPSPAFSSRNGSDDVGMESVKFSFRAGGEKVFHERLKTAMIQRQWLLHAAPPIPKPIEDGLGAMTLSDGSSPAQKATPKLVGIAGLERRGQDVRKTNEVIIGNAFSDLEALMTSAKEIIALAEQFRSQTSDDSTSSDEANAILQQSASALGLMSTTKDMLKSDTVYLSELARNLAEFLTDDRTGILKKEGGIMSLVDLWSVYNRARGGVELVSPSDFAKAAELWEKLRLPLRLRRFKSGLLVVQGVDRTDERTISAILAWLAQLRAALSVANSTLEPTGRAQITWDIQRFGGGITPQETAERFGWSVGVAAEELEMAEDYGALCREEGFGGVRFWENWIVKLGDVPTLI